MRSAAGSWNRGSVSIVTVSTWMGDRRNHELKGVLPDNEMVEVSNLIENYRLTTPIALKMSTPECYKDMPAAIILNICKNPLNRLYPWHGLQKIKHILSKDYEQESTKMQWVLLVHVSKMELQATVSAGYLSLFENMVMHDPKEQWTVEWLTIAKKTIQNKYVKKAIEYSICKSFGVESQNAREIDVKFVKTFESDLRGFSGIDCVLINFSHFDPKRTNNETFPDCKTLMGIDIITLVLHEYSHVRVRQILDNFNMATPLKILPSSTTSNDLEFGRITERNFFGVSPDWVKSWNRGNESGARVLSFAESFVKAVCNNKEPPTIPRGLPLIDRRGPVSMGGADILSEYSIE